MTKEMWDDWTLWASGWMGRRTINIVNWLWYPPGSSRSKTRFLGCVFVVIRSQILRRLSPLSWWSSLTSQWKNNRSGWKTTVTSVLRHLRECRSTFTSCQTQNKLEPINCIRSRSEKRSVCYELKFCEHKISSSERWVIVWKFLVCLCG